MALSSYWIELNSKMEERDMIHGRAQLTSFDPENVKCDLYDGKNDMLLTLDPN